MVDPFSPIAHQEPTHSGGLWVDKKHENKGTENDEQRRKAARRKSLANRRVSFAPEATLHTWSVMELLEDSTTSSASNSTRRQSTMTSAQSPLVQTSSPQQDRPDRPTTPVEQHNEEVVQGTPESQRTLHQRKRRRSSDTIQSSDDEAMSSPGDGGDSSPIRVEDSIDSESDTDGDTAMSLDEATSHTVRSTDSASTQTSLDERLRQAASQAGTRGIDHDENLSADEDDQTMELANNTVTHAFKKYGQPSYPILPNSHVDNDENIDHFSNGNISAIEYGDDEPNQEDPTMGMTMDMTRAVGGIVHNKSSNHTKSFSNCRKSNASRRASYGDDTSYGDETMDLTVAKGGILANGSSESDGDEDHDDDGDQQMSDEDMTMEMTNVIGGLRNTGKRESTQSLSMEDTESMDMTMAAGAILAPIKEQTEPQTDIDEEMTGAMDMTRAVGKIIPQQQDEGDEEDPPAQDARPIAAPTPTSRPTRESILPTTGLQNGSRHMTTIASDTGSPTLKPRLSARRSAPNSRSSTPRSIHKSFSSELNGQTTPSKQLTPLPAKSSSPQRTPLLPVNVMHRGASPKKLFVKELRERSSPASRKCPRRQQDALFSKDENTGLHTPRVVLQAPKPHQSSRRKSSVKAADDAESHGSPRVSEILSRRSSIGDAAPDFQLQQGRKRSLRFEDPQEMAQEIEAERAEEQRRESGRFIMEQESNEQHDENTTQNLRDMIESMTPKKENSSKFKSRKSLAVGSASTLR